MKNNCNYVLAVVVCVALFASASLARCFCGGDFRKPELIHEIGLDRKTLVNFPLAQTLGIYDGDGIFRRAKEDCEALAKVLAVQCESLAVRNACAAQASESKENKDGLPFYEGHGHVVKQICGHMVNEIPLAVDD